MDDIKVSVYCLAYNHEKYIRKALEGFVMQKTNFDYEVLVHDDASTDGTAEIIREFELKYPNIIKPIYQKVNQYSQKVDIKEKYFIPHTKGKYVACCEGDDYWIDENKLQLQYDFMEEHSDVCMCVHKVQCVSEDCDTMLEIIPGRKFGLDSDCIITPEKMASLLYDEYGYPFHTSSYFMRVEVLKAELQKILRGRLHGDATHLRVAMSMGKLFFMNSVMSHRRMWTVGNWNNRMKSLSNKKRVECEMRAMEGEILFDEFTENKFHEWILPSIYQRLYLVLRDYEIRDESKMVRAYRLKNPFRCTKSIKLAKKIIKYYIWYIYIGFASLVKGNKQNGS